MLTLEKIREKMADRNIQEVCRQVNLPSSTIYRVLRDKNANVSYRVVKILSDYLEQK